jgi:hypothetical protein
MRKFSGTQQKQTFLQSSFRGKRCTHYPAKCLATRAIVSLMRLSSLIVIRCGRGLGIRIAASRHLSCRPHSYPWNCTCSLYLHQLAMNAQKPNHTAYFRHLLTLAIGLPFQYRLQGDPTPLRCTLVTAWQHRHVTRVHYMVKSAGGWCSFTWNMLWPFGK